MWDHQNFDNFYVVYMVSYSGGWPHGPGEQSFLQSTTLIGKLFTRSPAQHSWGVRTLDCQWFVVTLCISDYNGHLFIEANHERLLSCDPSLLAVVSMVTKLDCLVTANCDFLCLWILAQLSVGSK